MDGLSGAGSAIRGPGLLLASAIVATLAFASSAIAQSDSGGVADPDAEPSVLLFLIFIGGASLVSLLALRKRGVLRAGGLDRHVRDCGGVGAIVWLIGAMSVYAATYFGAMVGVVIAQQSGFERGSLEELGLMNLGTYTVACATAVVLILAMRPVSVRAGLIVRARDLAIGPLLFLLIIPTVWIVGVASTEIAEYILTKSGEAPPEELGHETLRALAGGSGLWWWVVMLSAAIGAPVVEELIYRGFLQSALRRAGAPGWTTVVIVSALFASVHVGSADLWTLPSLFVLSLALGASMELTGRVGAPILIHALFNASMLAIAEFTA